MKTFFRVFLLSCVFAVWDSYHCQPHHHRTTTAAHSHPQPPSLFPRILSLSLSLTQPRRPHTAFTIILLWAKFVFVLFSVCCFRCCICHCRVESCAALLLLLLESFSSLFSFPPFSNPTSSRSHSLLLPHPLHALMCFLSQNIVERSVHTKHIFPHPNSLHTSPDHPLALSEKYTTRCGAFIYNIAWILRIDFPSTENLFSWTFHFHRVLDSNEQFERVFLLFFALSLLARAMRSCRIFCGNDDDVVGERCGIEQLPSSTRSNALSFLSLVVVLYGYSTGGRECWKRCLLRTKCFIKLWRTRMWA